MVSPGENKVKPEADQRRARATRLARLVPPLARKAYRARGFASDEAIARWRDIVGDELAGVAVPIRLRFRRGSRREGVLELRVDPAYATQVQHRSEQILERLNTYFGYRAVAALTLVQGLIAEIRPHRHENQDTPQPPDSLVAARAERLANRVEDDKLRSLLRRWGAEILDSEQS